MAQTKILPAIEEGISIAADALRCGEVVAIPTETVYGLAADATNADAVAKIFAVKGRPANNPLIVHVDRVERAKALTPNWTEAAEQLARKHWPGPLTIVVEAGPRIAAPVLAGGHTVGLRIPAHPVALRLLQATGLPLAAPSANLSNRLSPTSAEAVLDQLDGRIPYILDGGPCAVGIESTVVDATGGSIRVLRPGMIQLREASAETAADGVLRSPGLFPKHYAPVIPMVLLEAGATLPDDSFVITLDADLPPAGRGRILPSDPGGYAAQIYSALREGERSGAALIAVIAPPASTEWAPIWDRLRRAAHRG